MNDSAAIIIAEALNNIASAINNLANNPPKKKKKEAQLRPVEEVKNDIEELEKKLTPIQRLVEAWKKVIDLPESEYNGWDRVNFARHAKTAKSLMEVFNCPKDPITSDLEPIVQCMIDVHGHLTKAGLNCTLETIIKHSHDWRMKNGLSQ